MVHETTVYRNTCPRNCYSTCGMLSHVENGKLVKVSGDVKHGYTNGKLCAKGYASTQLVYNSSRLKYPMRQNPRGSGNWQRISWEEAYTVIAEKMIDLNKRFESNLACGYNKFSGNLGFLHYAVEGMFNSIGPHTKPVGNLCASTGEESVKQSFGRLVSSNPENMTVANLIVIWGANPAVTNIHQFKYIYQAQDRGAKFVVIDPIYTQTAEKADLYIQIQPGTDYLLALGVSKLLMEGGLIDQEFIKEQTADWSEFKEYLTQLTLQEVCQKTGIAELVIRELATMYANQKSIATWNGIGIQRTRNGGKSISAINTLAAITGNIANPYGGIYYSHRIVDYFPMKLLNHPEKKHPTVKQSREIDICNYAQNTSTLSDPPLKFLWIASRNIFAQDHNLEAWEQLCESLEMIVTVDLYLTKTAERADIVLPTTSHFEEEDLNVSYWHYWLSINQKAIEPYYEAKSDLQIARDLTKKLNALVPGFSQFPNTKEPMDWINEEISDEIKDLYSLTCMEDLFDGPRQIKKDIPLLEVNEKFTLYIPEKPDEINHGECLPEDNLYPYRVLTSQSLLMLHSQFDQLLWLQEAKEKAFIEISLEIATKHDIADGSQLVVYNDNGAIVCRSKINIHLPKDIILASQAGLTPINQLMILPKEALGEKTSTPFNDVFVNVRNWRGNHV